jgi:hypothetical protein
MRAQKRVFIHFLFYSDIVEKLWNTMRALISSPGVPNLTFCSENKNKEHFAVLAAGSRVQSSAGGLAPLCAKLGEARRAYP